MGGNIDTSNKEGKWKREISRGNRQHGVLEGLDSFSRARARAYMCTLYTLSHVIMVCVCVCVCVVCGMYVMAYIYIYIYIYILRLHATRIYNDWRRRGGRSAGAERARGALPYIPSFFSDPLGARLRFSSLTARERSFRSGRGQLSDSHAVRR